MIKEYNLIKPEDLGKGSNIKLEACENEHDMYWKMAIEVLEVIGENNRKGEDTVMVVPYGPLGCYSKIVYLVNKYRISLKNCWFINMDEYINEDGKYIDESDPLSFRGGMNRIFYSLIDDELNVPESQRFFPDPNCPEKVQEIIDMKGKLDMAWGGVGINGHFAFNEPPEKDAPMTDDEFVNLPTRVLPISRETKTINCYMNCGGDLEGIPELCITVGMKEMFQAKKVRMLQPRDWNAGALRKILHGPITCAVPCSLFQNHPDAKLYAGREAMYNSVIPEIRIYNK
ncbi:MAG: glucosamine-6-phosphate isomerase [Clostridia bacterium]|nr:glucosamine-6-phosphate isomerase [Clostridia bacterium]